MTLSYVGYNERSDEHSYSYAIEFRTINIWMLTMHKDMLKRKGILELCKKIFDESKDISEYLEDGKSFVKIKDKHFEVFWCVDECAVLNIDNLLFLDEHSFRVKSNNHKIDIKGYDINNHLKLHCN